MKDITLSGYEFRKLMLCTSRYAMTRPVSNVKDILEFIKRNQNHPMMPLEQMIKEARCNKQWQEALEEIHMNREFDEIDLLTS